MFTILLILEQQKRGAVDFEKGDIRTSAHLYWKLTKNLCRACLLSYCFWVSKAFKSSLDLYFHLESQRRYTLRLLLCLEAMEKGFSCFPGRDWEGFNRNLLSLVKLYQRIWIWNLNQHLIMALLIVSVCTLLL